MRVQFVASSLSNHYDTLKVTVLNRTDGPVDTLSLNLKELLGKKTVPGTSNFKNGVEPHIWESSGKVEWYAYYPTAADYQTMRQAVGDYLDVFRDRRLDRVPTPPCSVKKNKQQKERRTYASVILRQQTAFA